MRDGRPLAIQDRDPLLIAHIDGALKGRCSVRSQAPHRSLAAVGPVACQTHRPTRPATFRRSDSGRH